MASNAPNSTWHPAMMPNSTADLPRNQTEETTTGFAQEEAPVEDSLIPAATADQAPAWMSDEDGGEDWMADTNAPAASDEQAEDEADSAQCPSPARCHMIARTNSFPAVAPAEDEAHDLERPIAFNEAEDLMRKIEQEEIEEEGTLPDATTGTLQGGSGAHDTKTGPLPQQYMGGSVEVEDDALGARFEEGLPLVPSKPDQPSQTLTAVQPDLFADDAVGEEDDFFSNVQADKVAQEEDDFQPLAMERKSTMDVLQSLDMAPSSTTFAPLEQTAEESEPEEEIAQAQSTQVAPVENAQAEPKPEGENVDKKWEAMFGDDEEDGFLPDEGGDSNELDAAAFLGSDDEGLLEDTETEELEPTQPITTPGFAPAPAPSSPAVRAQYLPPNLTPTVPTPPTNPYAPAISPVVPANPFLPASPATFQPPIASPYAAAPTAPSAQYGYGASPPIQEKSKAQSFVDKAKGGYTSPYDLPMEVVKVPKRRSSAQPPDNTMGAHPPPAAVAPPPRSASMQAHRPPPLGPPAHGTARPGSSQSSQGPPSGRKQPQEGFFEELPIVSKPRPGSRTSHKGMASPTQPSPYGLPPQSAPPVAPHLMHPPPPAAPSGPGPELPSLVAAPRIDPYASLSSGPGLPPPAPAVPSTRYSPAPPTAAHGNMPVPAPVSSRYSPAPPASRPPASGYGPVPAIPTPPILPHQPRTSSPLAHFEVSHERSRPHAPVSHPEGGLGDRRGSGPMHELRLQRVPSLPPTREVEEEEAPVQAHASPSSAPLPQPMSPPVSRYAPPPQAARQTPPPSALSGHAVLSPPKRVMSSHSPLAPPYEFAPPARSQTQSPGQLYGNRPMKQMDPIPRPSSVNDPTSPRATAYQAAPIPPASALAAPPMTYGRPRGASLNLNVIPPTDGRENDPLQRWRGTPLVSWGVGGMFVTMFPKEVPRYGMNQAIPAVVRSPGDVKIQTVKDIIPFEERLSKFPGPLKGKSKKKETIAWLTTGIETMEQGLPTNAFHQIHLSHEDKRAVERVLLWKILRVFVENDGVLEGNPTVEKAVRDILSPGHEVSDGAPPFMNGAAGLGLNNSSITGMQADAVSPATVDQIRHHLLSGDSEKAVWAAVDQRLWAHALLLSHALDPDLYKQVAQEFVKKEVNFPGHNNESLAALYGVLSGNHEESVDELVPVHARAGLQLMAKGAASGPSKDAMEGLDKWRETLSLILSNRSNDDTRAINSLGVLLSGYGRAEAAHICFMFAHSQSVFGGLDDPTSHFVLVGSDHKKQSEFFAKEIEPLLLSEVYEYGQSLAGASNVPVTNPHLAAYKLQHALALAEYGFRDKALQYCDAIAAAITAQTKRSPYYHPLLENAVEDLMSRLKQAPKEESSSWIPKPSMNKVSDTVWSKFNKFVSGDDDAAAPGSSAEGAEVGPFARVAGDTPTISRSPSVAGLETFGAVPSYGMPTLPAAAMNGSGPISAPPTRAASRYAPGAAGSGSRPSTSAYAPRSSMERTSGEMNRGSFELPRRSVDMQSGRSGIYSPVRSGSPAIMYTPHSAEFNAPQQSPLNPAPQPAASQPPASAPPQSVGYLGAPVNGIPSDQTAQSHAPELSGYQPPSYGYEPPSFTPYQAPTEEKKESMDEPAGASSYEPPSYQPYGYEPPSYEPSPQPENDASSEEKPKPKKKGIMYDDEDDFPTPRPAEKTKEEKDRENAEMFRKAAEEDAKRASEASKQTKKGWGFTSWFGGSKKTPPHPQTQDPSNPNKPIRAKLGEPNSFYYDPDLKRWINKNASADDPPPLPKRPRRPHREAAPAASRALSAPALRLPWQAARAADWSAALRERDAVAADAVFRADGWWWVDAAAAGAGSDVAVGFEYQYCERAAWEWRE
ncbi:vesicle coat component [Collariella sp. IMI 366227]|nr:vesicle coat component [Collariella sp. IMI 366227]